MQHEASKRHGKLKGKRLRLALNWANLRAAFAGVEPNVWPTTIPATAMQVADLLGRDCDGVTDAVNEFIRRSKPTGDQLLTASAPKEERGQVGNRNKLLQMSLENLLEQNPVASYPHLQKFLSLIRKMHTVWLDLTLLRARCFIRDNLPQASLDVRTYFVLLAWFLFQKLQMATCSISTNTNWPTEALRSEAFRHPREPTL